jgi:hypothetical protein
MLAGARIATSRLTTARLFSIKQQCHFNFTKGATMTARMIFGSFVMMCVLALSAQADGKGEIQKYFNDAAAKVKATANPSEKRAILNKSFNEMSKALDMVQRSPGISQDDRAGIDRLQATVHEWRNELEGSNGYLRVPDGELNAFSNYVVQDMEQAGPVIAISLVTLLLIVILLVLIL